MNEQTLVHEELQGAVLRLTLDDQATRNSLSEAMMQQLSGRLAAATAADEIHVIILAAKGKVFSSGHNLKELTAHRSDPDNGLAYYEKVFALCSDLMMQITHHRCPVIAEVGGLASAAGCQLVAACDLAYASPDAGFCTPGVNIGLFCSTPMVPLSRNVSSKHAMEMLLTGEIKDAKFAERVGLINAVIEKDQLTQHVTDTAQTVAAKSQAAIAYGKRTFYDQRSLPLSDAYALASSIMVKNMLDGAACEGLDAFINKRQPVWPKVK
ncbi:MAG: enoyl-CoA hydratase [Rhizobiaceae bacterium]